MAGSGLAPSDLFMSPEPLESAQRELQILDTTIVDVLSHLEALLRHSHSIQRQLLGLREEAPPPVPRRERVIGLLQQHANDMYRECAMLAQLILDIATGVNTLAGETNADERRNGVQRRSGLERRVE